MTDWTNDTAPPIDCGTELKDIDFGILIPGAGISATVQPKEQLSLSKQDLADIVAGNAGFYYRSCIYFEDAGGNPYHMVISAFFQHDIGSATGTFQQCPKGDREY
jgi:hypothetical protein